MADDEDKKNTKYEAVYKKADMSVFEEFYFQKEQGDITAGSDGVALLQSAVGTGVGILRSRRNADGEPLYGYSKDDVDHEEIEIEFEGETINVINCYHHVQDAYNDEVYAGITAGYEGDADKGKLQIKAAGLTADSYKGAGYEKALEVGERAKWEKAKTTLNEVLGWIEGEFGSCGLIDPFIKKSLLSQRAELIDAKKIVLKANDLAVKMTEELRKELELEREKNKEPVA